MNEFEMLISHFWNKNINEFKPHIHKDKRMIIKLGLRKVKLDDPLVIVHIGESIKVTFEEHQGGIITGQVIFIKTLTGKTYTIEFNPSDTTDQLKKKIHEKALCPPSE